MRNVHSRLLLNLFCFIIPAHFTVAYLTMTQVMVPFGGTNGLRPSGNPFDYRMLPVLLWQALVHVGAWLHLHPHLPILNPPFTSNENWFVAILTYSCLTGATFVMRDVLRALNGSVRLEWLALLLPLMAYFDLVLVLNRNLYYPYDLTALLLFALLISAAFQNRVWLMAALLIPAMLNKETAATAVLAFAAFAANRESWPRILAKCAGLAAVVIVVRIAQRVWISHVCGCSSMHEVHLAYNLKQLANPLFWLSATSVFAYLWLLVLALWKEISSPVRRALLWVCVPWCCVMLYAGILRELRIFSDLSVLILLAIATGLQRRYPAWFQVTPACGSASISNRASVL